MKKRLCTLCLILLAVGTTFAGCKKKTSDEPASEKKVTQTIAFTICSITWEIALGIIVPIP